MKLHPSYIADLQSLAPLDNLWMKSSVPMFIDTACTLPVDNPCSLEVITLADIRFKDPPTLTISDKNGNEVYVTQPVLVEDSFASSTPATPATNWNELVGKPSTFAPSAHNQDWSTITTGKPTTIAGYGITDAFTQALADARYPQLSVQYTNPTWLAGIDATTIKTGTIDLARLPALPSANTIVCTTIPAMSAGDQLLVSKGTVVIESTTGNTYRYSGTGSVVLNASYIQQSDLTPDWAVITNKPTNVSTWANDAGYLTAASSLAWGKLTGVPATFTPSAHTHAQSDITGLETRLAGIDGNWVNYVSKNSTTFMANGVYIAFEGAGSGGIVTRYKNASYPTDLMTSCIYGGMLGFGYDGVMYENVYYVGSGTGGYVRAGNWRFDTLQVGGVDVSTTAHTHTFASLTSKPTTLAGYGITDAASSSHTHTFASLTSKPTTLAGYGITDGALSTHNHDSAYLAKSAGVGTGEFHFSYSAYSDPDVGVSRDAKFGGTGIATASLKVGSLAGFVRATAGVISASALVASDIPALDWSKITTGKPTTLAGYGITDAATSTHNHDSTYFKLAAGSVHSAGSFTALYPTLAVGDGQYGMSALGGSLNLYSVGGIRVYTRSGSADAVFAGNVWHSGNLGFGTSAGSMCQGNDSRLSDARTPSNNAAIVQGSVNNSGAQGKRTYGLGSTANAINGVLDSGFYDTVATTNPNGSWMHVINSAHNNNYAGNQYQFQIAASFSNDKNQYWGPEGYWVRTICANAQVGAWRKLWHDGNLIGDQGTTHTHSQYLTTATASSTYLPLAGGTLVGAITSAYDATFGGLTVGGSIVSGGLNAQGGSITTTSSVTAGSFIMSGGTATGFLMSNGTKMEKSVLNYFADSAWPSIGVTHGWAYTGAGSANFGFSASNGVVDVYADGNFYATDSKYLVWHAGNLTLSAIGAAATTHTHTQIEVSNTNEIVVGNGFNDVAGKLYVNWRGAGTNRISDYMLCDGKGAGVFSYITAAGFKLNGGTGNNLLSDNGSSVAMSSFALAGHNHNSTYATLVHNHDSAYFKLNTVSTQTVSGASTIFTSPIEARGSSVFVGDVELSDGAYTNAALEVSRSTNNNTYHAGIGFHNVGTNAAYLYYSNSTAKFRFRRHSPDDFGLWDSSDFTSANIGNWNTAWTRVAGGRLCEDAYTGEDTLDWIARMNRGNHWGRIHGVQSAPSYYNYMLIRETTGTKYSVIGCAADGNWYVGAAASNVNLTTYAKIWTSADFSATAVARINNSDSNYGYSRLYRADDQSKYYLKHRWTTGGWNGNSWRLECANDHADSQSGIFTVVTNYADVGNTAYTLTAKDGSNVGANIDTGFMGNYCGLWAGSVDAPTGTTPFGNSWTWLQEWGHGDGNWRAQLATPYFSDNLAFRRKNSGTWMPWRYVVSTDVSGNCSIGGTLTVNQLQLGNISFGSGSAYAYVGKVVRITGAVTGVYVYGGAYGVGYVCNMHTAAINLNYGTAGVNMRRWSDGTVQSTISLPSARTAMVVWSNNDVWVMI